MDGLEGMSHAHVLDGLRGRKGYGMKINFGLNTCEVLNMRVKYNYFESVNMLRVL